MNTIKRDYFGNERDTKTYQELQLDFCKKMLSFTIVTNKQSHEINKKNTHCDNKKN